MLTSKRSQFSGQDSEILQFVCFFFTKDTVVVVNVQTEVLMLAEWRGLKIVIHVIIFR